MAPPKVVVRNTQSKAWIAYALLTGLVFGLGNTVFGVRCSMHGFWGACLVGPSMFAMSILYRLVESCIVKKRTGKFINWDRSNYWRRKQDTQSPQSDLESDNDYR